MSEPYASPIRSVCSDCGCYFTVFKNDRLCKECEKTERDRLRAKGALGRSMRARRLAGRVDPQSKGVPAVRPSLAIRLHGKRGNP